MKKLLVLAAMTASLAASATMVDWKYSGVAADSGASIYLYVVESGSSEGAPTSFADLDAVKAKSVDTGKTVVGSSNPRTGATSYLGNGSAERDWSNGDKFYYVLVSSDTFYVDPTAVTVTTGDIYEKGSSSPGPIVTSTSASTHTYGGFSGGGSGGGDVPEPTSGLLLLVGGAMLALRRKQK